MQKLNRGEDLEVNFSAFVYNIIESKLLPILSAILEKIKCLELSG
jgi:hypothetical protein